MSTLSLDTTPFFQLRNLETLPIIANINGRLFGEVVREAVRSVHAAKTKYYELLDSPVKTRMQSRIIHNLHPVACCPMDLDAQAQVYLVECTSGDESILKVGMTSNFNKRFARGVPYKVKPLLLSKQISAGDAHVVEQAVLKLLFGQFVSPRKYFTGHTECVVNSRRSKVIVSQGMKLAYAHNFELSLSQGVV